VELKSYLSKLEQEVKLKLPESQRLHIHAGQKRSEQVIKELKQSGSQQLLL
jgi:hypothetical protein